MGFWEKTRVFFFKPELKTPKNTRGHQKTRLDKVMSGLDQIKTRLDKVMSGLDPGFWVQLSIGSGKLQTRSTMHLQNPTFYFIDPDCVYSTRVFFFIYPGFC